jgi:hypothetical protein
MVVGLGAGITLEEVPATVSRLDVVELEPEVVRANLAVAARRRRDPLADPRLALYLQDARSALLLTGRRFDAVVSQPSHPWTAGASHLFTRELFALVRERLAPGGVFVQWIGLDFVDDELLRSVLATLLDVYPEVEVWSPPPGGGALFLASERPLDTPGHAAEALAAAPREWAELGVFDRDDLMMARLLDRRGAARLAAGAPLVTDLDNRLQTRSPRVLDRPLRRAGLDRLVAPYDPLLAGGGGAGGLDRLYLVRRLIRGRDLARARRLAEVLGDPIERATAVALVDLAEGHRRHGARALAAAVARYPAAPEPRDSLLLLYQGAIRAGRPLPAALWPAADPAAGPAATLVAAWRAAGAGDPAAVAALDDRLAAVDPHHVLYPEAVRLRAGWRLAAAPAGLGGEAGSRRLAAEALTLLEPALFPVAQVPDLALRARAAAAIGDPATAIAALLELAQGLEQRPRHRPALLPLARRLFAALPPEAATDPRTPAIAALLDELTDQ